MTTETHAEWDRSRGCDGKRRFVARREAARVASMFRRQGHTGVHPYRCRHCATWHIGHRLGEGTGLRAKQRRP